MREAQEVGSILAADFGSVTTHVVLMALVNGRYRLVARAEAPTTALPPFGDVGEGLRHALGEMSRTTGRLLLSEADQLILPERVDGAGVDQFVATASGGRPMRAVLVGLVPEISLESGRRASASTYMTIEDTISLADQRSENEQIDAILNVAPDVVVIVGGTDGGAEASVLDMVKRVAVALSLMNGDRRPRVLFAGNAELRQQVRETLGEQTDVHAAENVRPSLAEEKPDSAQTRLATVYDDYKSNSPGGFREISQWSRVGVLPTAQSVSRVLRFLATSLGSRSRPVLGLDLGSATTMLAAVWRSRSYISVRADLGLGHSAVPALDCIDLENVTRWLSFGRGPEDVRDYAWNKWLRPGTAPQSRADLEMEMALARELIRAALEGVRNSWCRLPRHGVFLPSFDPIVLAGAVFGRAPHPGYAALLALDALQPVGVCRLLLDPYGLVPALGAAAYLTPTAVVQVLGSGGLPILGTVIAPIGRVKAGQVALRVRIRAGGTTRSEVVHAGSVRLVRLEWGEPAEIAVRPHRRLNLGRGNGRTVALRARGGMLGLVCDARGRPLPLPRTAEDRARIYSRWAAQATGQEDAVLS
jgi:hypothetical protein